ncbi:hypothetical protein PLESTB_001768900 [Pleodorina starrii]|uniref:Uncharacterized protein n=1 Tax=Pleodorina starrii TaxID=330485 RepID=A0A9W6C137_9CHLO|nr:hypothetical protein PLESTM_001864200 [Pleodorina starrii]GLC61552.1 hypothetical protein PLESTB_001768900 [Pleodorina starrii]GLC76831.1 hypothetical protein PLESTF_001845800 [Pleodorina starrii]
MEARSEAEQELYTELAEEVYHELEQFVADPAFCNALEKPARNKDGILARWRTGWGKAQRQDSQAAGSSERMVEDLEPAPSEEMAASSSGTAGDGLQDSFVVIDKKDAVESMAFYVAACIADLPEAQALTPKELQSALVDALRTLKRSRFQRVCTWGRRVYRWSTYTYSAVQVYQNPWLMRALLAALWATSRVSMRMLL